MKIHSKAPFRLGLAGGGTDVSPYSDKFGGAVLNATVDLFAHTTIIPRTDGKILIKANNLDKAIELDAALTLEINGELDLQKGVYNRITREFTNSPLSFELITEMDVPSGSGLGTSSTVVVSILGAFVEWLKLPLNSYEIAQLAFSIEREDLKMAGGKQDQYAATFGGINFIEFGSNSVQVNPLSINTTAKNKLENNLLLYYTQTSRQSSKIIELQADNVIRKVEKPINAMHFLKKQAFIMKDALIAGDLNEIGKVLDKSWQQKKLMADGISNSLIDEIYTSVMNAGAGGGKISGAGGGGFMIFYVDDSAKKAVLQALKAFKGTVKSFKFSPKGLITWTTDE
ncbi:GHMP kinase [Crocinitomix sp.]|nr:GHMP kinase [Crocinitomix sp.]